MRAGSGTWRKVSHGGNVTQFQATRQGLVLTIEYGGRGAGWSLTVLNRSTGEYLSDCAAVTADNREQIEAAALTYASVWGCSRDCAAAGCAATEAAK